VTTELRKGSAAIAALLFFHARRPAGRAGRDGSRRAIALGLAAACVCGEAGAGAWPLEPGETLAILKYETARSDEAWDLDGRRYSVDERTDETVSLYLERGVTRRITLQGKAGWSRGEEAGLPYEGRAPIELGLRYALRRSDDWAVSLYLGGVLAGEGRNAGYALPGAGKADVEVRLLAGRSFPLGEGRMFVEGQAARLARTGLPDETRLDLTAGYQASPRWLILAQSYGGVTDAEPAWLKLETSAVGRFGDWSLQAGWRASAAGRAGPVEDGPVVAVWRRF